MIHHDEKLLAALLVFTLSFCACFALAEQVREEEYVTLADTGLQMWLPSDLKPVELTEEYAELGYLCLFEGRNTGRTVDVWVNPELSGTLNDYALEILNDSYFSDICMEDVGNDMRCLCYSTQEEGATVRTAVFSTEEGDYIEISIAPYDDAADRQTAMAMIHSIRKAEDQVFFTTFNIDAVENGPRYYPDFRTPEAPLLVRSITTYHWNYGQGCEPGTISLYDWDDQLIGTWNAVSRGGSGAENVYWDVYPNIILEPSKRYYVMDSDTDTWSSNAGSKERGFVEIRATTAFDSAKSSMGRTEEGNLAMTAIVRDFKADGLLFEGSLGSRQGLVAETLGADRKPLYNMEAWQAMYGDGVTPDSVYAFFNDVPGVNVSTEKTMVMKSDPEHEGFWLIDSAVGQDGAASDGLFLIDNELYGNEGRNHNFHFSVEFHTSFRYVEGARFDFEGDDDLWVFINGHLLIDLGGVHSRQSASIALEEYEDEIGIRPGDIVRFDLFYMERHTSQSNMRIRTNFQFMIDNE